ncbi:271f17ce-81b3-45b4-b7da-a0a760cfa961-CDS [Sclerotinia trifoliorum]|uniref:271f17ce-81b3-45b4-b7da-a0a760cfa961-CDS n=1 Tax=Sclerotinia trifoliorum TaxID=28548 RepID=A0A8H2VWE5_9HELO|nr:271f17ce-81b3-45b4-b7da-a0a760cfa961-CDS [Sclerotinia trifoliorum]
MSTGTPLKNTLLSFPTASTLLITINRPSSLNCLDTFTHNELDRVFRWFDAEPGLRCAILTGVGRSFCAGADLKEWDSNNSLSTSASSQARSLPTSGFGGLSRRGGKKPIICAVNGICFGGGCEMIINADMVIAEAHAVFALPEVKIGVVALAGALTRLVRTVGKQRAMEMALTGRTLGAEEAMEWGLVNRVVGTGKSVEEAIKMAELIAANSPDSVIVSREGIKMGWEGVGAEEGTRLIEQNWYSRMDKGPNMKEGVRSFVEKRKPNWVPSKL